MKGKKITIITSIIVIALIIVGLFTRKINNTIISSNSKQQKNTASNSLEIDEEEDKKNMFIEWQKSIGSDYVTEFKSAVKTPDGGIIAVGSTDTNTSIEKETKKGYGNQDGIIVKYSSDGTVVWSKFLGGEGYDELFHIETKPNKSDESEEVYVIGGYVDSSVLKYGDKELEEIGKDNEITDDGYTDGIIMTIDGNGDINWAKTIGGTGKARINAVAINKDGDVGVTGSYYGSITLGKDKLTSSGKKDGFVCVFSNEGGYKWSKNLDSKEDTIGKAITATSDGFAVGVNFQGELTIGKETTNKVNTKGKVDAIVIRFLSNGDCKWNKQIGSSKNDEVYDIITDVEKSEIIAVGCFGEKILSFPLYGGGKNCDGMLLRINEESGKVKKVVSTIGSGKDSVIDSVDSTSNGGVLLGGWTYEQNLRVRNDLNGEVIIKDIFTSNKGMNDGFIIELDDSDNIVWSDAIQGELYDCINDIVYMEDGSFYAVGDLNSKKIESLNCTIKKDEALQNEVLLGNNDSYNSDAFVIKYKEEPHGQVTVHYVLKGENDEKGQEEESLQEIMKGKLGKTYTTQAKEINHYELEEGSQESTTGTYTTEENVDIYYYYVLKKYDYRIEYYFDGEIDSESTKTKNAKYNSIVTESPKEKRDGYKLVNITAGNEKNDPNENKAQLQIDDDLEKNVIKFYYENTEFKNITVKKVWEMNDVEAENYKATIQLMRVKDGEKIPLLDKDGNEIKVEIIGNRTNTIENVPVNNGGGPIKEYALKEIKVEKRVEDKWEEVSLTQFDVSYQIEKSDEHN